MKKLQTVIMALTLAAVSMMQTSAAAVSSKGSNVTETGLGNLVADALVKAADADIAFVPASMLREVDIDVTKLTAASVTAAITIPTQELVTIPITGKQVREALERSVSLAPKPHAGFLQVAGLTFRYDNSFPVGQRLGDILIERKVIDPAKEYSVAMPMSLATGALGYFRIWPNVKPQKVGDQTLQTAIQSFITDKFDPTAYVPDGRIRKL